MRAIINIDVPALASAIDFYCAALPLRHSRSLDDDVAELQGASCLIYLLQNDEHSPSSAGVDSETRHYVRHWTPVHLDFVVDDLEAAAARRAGGRRPRKPPGGMARLALPDLRRSLRSRLLPDPVRGRKLPGLTASPLRRFTLQ